MTTYKKYTKSPWEVVYRDDDHCMSMTVIAPKGSMGETSNICRLSAHSIEEQQKPLAITWHQLTPWAGHEALDRDEEDGNDTLMAMAPEMFELLLDLKKYGYLLMVDPELKEKAEELLSRMEAS